MFARSLRRSTLAARQVRAASTKRSSVNGKGGFDGIYKVFMKNNVTYITSIVVAALVVESAYGTTTNYIWESLNRGRLYHHIDWSQFKTDDDEEEEEEEEEEEDEEGADEGDDVVDDLHDEDEE